MAGYGRSSAPRLRRVPALLAITTAAALLSGCSAPAPAPTPTGWHGLPITGAAEPGDAPVPTATPAGTVVALPAGSHPWGVAAAPAVGRVFVAPRHQDRLMVVDMASHAVRTVPAPGSARMIDLAAPDGPLLLPAEDKAAVFRLALPELDVVGSAATRKHPHQAAVLGDTTFVSEEFGHAVAVVRAGHVVAQLTQPAQPGGITAVGDRVAVVDVHTNHLFVYDARSLHLLAVLPAGEGPSHVVPIGDGRVAVCDVRGHAVLTYRVAGTPRALGRVAVPGRAFWLESDPATRTVYAALSSTNLIAKLRIAADGRPALVSTAPTVRQPISMDLDAASGTLWVAGYADSQLQILPTSAFR